MSKSKCDYSGLGITHPATIACSDPGSNFCADIAKLGNNILLVKCYGYVTSSAESELLFFIDDFTKKYFESETGIFYIEDYADLIGGDAESRKKYITYFSNNHFFIAGIFYNLPPIYRLSVNLAKKLHIYAARAHAVNTYEQAVDLAEKLTRQNNISKNTVHHQTGSPVESSNPESDKPAASFLSIFKPDLSGVFPRMSARLKWDRILFPEKVKKRLAEQYSEKIIQYVAAIDWKTPGMPFEKNLLYDDVSSKKLFDAISFVKSEIDTLMEERDLAESVLRESESRYRFLVEHAKVGFMEYDFPGNRIFSVNDELERMTGYSRQELLAMSPMDFLNKESQRKFKKRLSQFFSGESVSHDVVYQCIKKNGDIFWVLLNSDIQYHNNRPEKASIVLTDITKLKHTEKQLLEYQEKLKSLSVRLSMIEEDQRRSMASHLHETIGQELFVMQLQLNAFEKTMDNPALLSTLRLIRDQLLKIIKETKSLTFDLSPPVLYDFGFEEALKTLAETIEAKHNIHVKTCFEGEMDAFEDEIKVILYRNVKELIHNSVKHADAENISIRLKSSPSGLDVELCDDGVGFDAAGFNNETAAHDGFGLFDIKEKLNHLGGRLTIDSTPGQGTSIHMHVPLDLKN